MYVRKSMHMNGFQLCNRQGQSAYRTYIRRGRCIEVSIIVPFFPAGCSTKWHWWNWYFASLRASFLYTLAWSLLLGKMARGENLNYRSCQLCQSWPVVRRGRCIKVSIIGSVNHVYPGPALKSALLWALSFFLQKYLLFRSTSSVVTLYV
jgi:hypothetical protein